MDPAIETRLSDLERQVRRALALVEEAQAPRAAARRDPPAELHGRSHELSGGDLVRPAWLDRATLLNRQEKVNATGGLGAAEDQANRRINLYLQGLSSLTTIPGCVVTASAAQSIPNAAWTALTYTTEQFDTDTIHDNAVNTSRLTCRTAGVYVVTASTQWALNTTGVRITGIRLNGATFLAQHWGGVPATYASPRHSVSVIYKLAVNDYLEQVGYQESGGALDTADTATEPSVFGMMWLGTG